MPGSLRANLLAWVLMPLALVVAIDAWVSFGNAFDTATVVQDRLLLGSARTIAEQIRFEDGSFQNQIPPAALELFQSTEQDRIYYRVTSGAGHLLAGYSDLAWPGIPARGPSPYFFNAVMRDMPVRAVALLQPVVGDPNARPVTVEVAQTMHGHAQLAHNLWIHTVRQQLLILAVATVFIVLGLDRGLLPLLRLRDLVNAREPGALQSVPVKAMPSELAPLAGAINGYIQRLEEHAVAQGVFLQNAAHQLRTPFALLNTQLSYAARASDAAGRELSLNAARVTVQHAGHLVNQLLTLSAAQALTEHTDARGGSPAAFEVAALVQQVFEGLSSHAQERRTDLGFEFSGNVSTLHAMPVAVREILKNLVDNAIRYTPAGGRVTVRFHAEGAHARLSVQDNGPGIPEAMRDKVFERFFRLHDSDSDGSGLGLAIVRELASRIGARVALATPSDGVGLVVVLEFADAQPVAARS